MTTFTHVLPNQRAIQKLHGFPPMSTGTYQVADPVAHFRALRHQHMDCARRCMTHSARREYIDYAFAASFQVRAHKQKLRDEAMRFGNFNQRAVGPGVYRLVPARRKS